MQRKLSIVDTIVVLLLLGVLVAYHFVVVHNLKKEYQAQQVVMFQSVIHSVQGKAFFMGMMATLRSLQTDTNNGRYYLDVTNVLNSMQELRDPALTSHIRKPKT
jgi:hypothetical protein